MNRATGKTCQMEKRGPRVLLVDEEESSLLPVWRIANLSMKIMPGAQTQKDVKNEDCTHEVTENTGA